MTTLDLVQWKVAPTLHWTEAFATWLKFDHRKFGKRGSLSQKSIEAYLQDVRHFSDFYLQAYGEAFNPDVLDEKVIRAYFDWMDMNRVKPATFNRRLTTMELTCQWLGASNLTLSVARKDVEYEPRDKTPDEYSALEEVANSMSHLTCETEKHGLLGMRDQITFALMGKGGGLRVSSVQLLNVDDVMARQLRIRGKGNLDQVIEITDEMSQALMNWIKRMPAPKADEFGTPLFVDWFGVRLTTGQLRRRLKMIGAKAGVDVTCHDLRATMGCQFYQAASQQLGAGYAAADATRRQMGHKDFRTTQKNYLRASRAQIRAAMEAM